MKTDCQGKRGLSRVMEGLSQMCPEQRDPDKQGQ
jgi:hypothetical protein